MSASDFKERMAESLLLLEAIVEDRGLLATLDDETRRRLIIAAGRVSRPDRAELRKLAKARRRLRKSVARDADDAVLEATGIRTLRRTPLFPTPAPILTGTQAEPSLVADELCDRRTDRKHGSDSIDRIDRMDGTAIARTVLNEPRKCYVCKAAFTEVHAFYDQMCPEHARENWERRWRTADLRGRVALVTGARVKIGYQAAIKLLRAGARVVVTTRFPRDAAKRYAAEPDFDAWRHRLDIHGLDLRHTPSVEFFCGYLDRTLTRLDYILNNACQTVRRPAGFYQHLIDGELASPADEPTTPILAGYEQLRSEKRACLRSSAHAADSRHAPDLAHRGGATQAADSAILSQLALLPEDRGRDLALFPDGELDADGQQVDQRGLNSWRLRLDEVSSVELLEVQLVNAVAPYVINARLRELMKRSHARDKHIVNVSAMEGQFYREWKTDRHPHTNMAKAALNMMTRTSASDYFNDGIHMNSVDTGWVTDEDPAEVAAKKTAEHRFHPPLDVVDGAARIVDPIFDGVLTGVHVYGLFLKDYRPVPW